MARTHQRILQDLLDGAGKGRRTVRKLSHNRDRNWLLAVILNSFAKLEVGAELTDLDRAVVGAFREHGFDDAELKSHGRLYLQLPRDFRRKVFPGQYARLTPDTTLDMQQVVADLPRIDRAVAAMPNATDVDVRAIHARRATEGDFPLPARRVLRRHGGGLTRAVDLIPDWPPDGPLPIPPDDDVPPDTKPTPDAEARYRIKATRFTCVDESHIDWTGSDEPTWIFGSLAEESAVTTMTGVSGESRRFASGDGNIWSQDGQDQPLPDGEIGVLVSLWEHESGDPDKVKKGVSAAFAAAATVLTATGVAAWIGAVVAGVGSVITWLVGFLDEDHIADQTFIFDRTVVENQLPAPGRSFAVKRLFSDGDADYRLTITVTRTS